MHLLKPILWRVGAENTSVARVMHRVTPLVRSLPQK
jgi:hypothetical protein